VYWREREALRRELIDRRAALGEAEVRAASGAVCGHLLALPALAHARSVALYAAVRGEIDPVAVEAALTARGVRTVYPRVHSAEPRGLTFHVARAGDLQPSAFGLAEPPAAAPVFALAAVDVVLVPGVAFARDGHRLGFGAGYFDGALAGAPTALRVGLCHPFQLFDRLAPREGDEPVDLIVLPDGPLVTRARASVEVPR
jgi:5-formyltetrahydrofolate cyclo-ligase